MINEIMNGSGFSAEVNPTAPVSEFTVSGGNGIGSVTLEYIAPNGKDWQQLARDTKDGAVNTPDPAYLYRFKAVNVTDVAVYFGP